MDEGTLARFWSHVDKNGPIHLVLRTRCWLWTGATDKDGYGVFGLSTKVKSVRVHRFAWFIIHGKWPEPQGLHKCDSPACCNPEHIFEGTPLNNMQDKVAKGRHVSGTKGRPELVARGEYHWNVMLTDVQVQQIRDEYVPRKIPLTYFAKKFGVAISTVHYALYTGRKSLEEVQCQ